MPIKTLRTNLSKGRNEVKADTETIEWPEDLHDAIKRTPCSFFRQIQNLKECIYPNA